MRINENIRAGHTGTLADFVDPSKFPMEMQQYEDDQDDLSKVFLESYDSVIERSLLREAKNTNRDKAYEICKYFYDTYDSAEDDPDFLRSFVDYEDRTGNPLGITSKEFNMGASYAIKKSKEELQEIVAKGSRFSKPAVAEGDKPDLNEENPENAFINKLRTSMQNFSTQKISIAKRVTEKYRVVGDIVRNIASGRSLVKHAIIYGDPGVGKTHAVAEAAQEGLKERKGPKPILHAEYGSIGAALGPLALFLFLHKDNEIVILDDADGFLVSRSQEVQDIIKAVLDPKTHPVTFPYSVMAAPNKEYQNIQRKRNKESIGAQILVKTNKLSEGKATIVINGKAIHFNVTPEEARLLEETIPTREVTPQERELFRKIKESKAKFNRFGRLNTFRESDFYGSEIDDDFESAIIDDDDFEDIPEIAEVNKPEKAKKSHKISKAIENDKLVDEVPDKIPTTFLVTSSFIFVTNLTLDEINPAIVSRCSKAKLHLTPDEFLCKAEAILDKLNVSETTLTEPELVKWAKYESFSVLKGCMQSSLYKGDNINLEINIKLEFRIISSLAGFLLARFDNWCMENHITDYLRSEVLQQFENEQISNYIYWDLAPFMKGDKL